MVHQYANIQEMAAGLDLGEAVSELTLIPTSTHGSKASVCEHFGRVDNCTVFADSKSFLCLKDTLHMHVKWNEVRSDLTVEYWTSARLCGPLAALEALNLSSVPGTSFTLQLQSGRRLTLLQCGV